MILQILTPTISTTFALCFLAIFFYDKSKKAPLILSIAYACGSVALILDNFRLSFDPAQAAIITNLLYSAALFLTTTSIAVHFRNRAPFLLMSVIAITEALILLYYIFWQPEITTRAIVANGSAASLMACSLLIIPRLSELFINRLLFWVAAATSLQFLLRAIFIFYMASYQGYVLIEATYSQSIIFISLHFSIAIFSLIFASTACLAFGIDAISDIKKSADIDILSGLWNRRGVEIEARKIIASTQMNKMPASLIAINIDRFKSINDNFGPVIGDEVIQTFGRILRTMCRNGDIVGRLEGDEFCILLQTADLNVARLTAEALRQTIEQKVFTADETKFFLTASFGMAELQEGENFNNLFARADEELMNSKRSGRNQVRPKRINYILKSVM